MATAPPSPLALGDWAAAKQQPPPNENATTRRRISNPIAIVDSFESSSTSFHSNNNNNNNNKRRPYPLEPRLGFSSSSSSYNNNNNNNNNGGKHRLEDRNKRLNPRGGGGDSFSKTSVSLPGAPLLVSQTRDRFGNDDNNDGNDDDEDLPPPMALEEQATPNASSSFVGGFGGGGGENSGTYGSLRESHLEGRFLDGPSSYRDKASGQIRPMSLHQFKLLRLQQQQPHTKTATTTTTQSDPPLSIPSISSRLVHPSSMMQSSSNNQNSHHLTPGERMSLRASSKKQQRKPSSTLSDLLNGNGQQPQQPQPQQHQHSVNSSTAPTMQLDDDEYEYDMDGGAFLSTSLTGLEVLQQHSSGTLLSRCFASDPTRLFPTAPPPSSILVQQPLHNPPSRLPSHESLVLVRGGGERGAVSPMLTDNHNDHSNNDMEYFDMDD